MVDFKLLTYKAGEPRAGMLVSDQVFDVAAVTGQDSYATVLSILDDWETAQPRIEAAAATIQSEGRQGMPLTIDKLLAPVLYPSTVYCAGANYSDITREFAKMENRQPPPDPHTLGLAPWHFIKSARSVVGHETVKLPRISQKVDWEAELAVVIGRSAKDVSIDEALGYVAGYTIANDLSARDLSVRKAAPPTSAFAHDWISQKCFDGACPLGPWMTPASQIHDPQNLGIKLWVNEVIKQDSSTNQMIYSVAEQISHLSTRITLYPGDLILTGSPAGVGLARGEFLHPGDIVKIWIEGVGTLTNLCA